MLVGGGGVSECQTYDTITEGQSRCKPQPYPRHKTVLVVLLSSISVTNHCTTVTAMRAVTESHGWGVGGGWGGGGEVRVRQTITKGESVQAKPYPRHKTVLVVLRSSIFVTSHCTTVTAMHTVSAMGASGWGWGS